MNSTSLAASRATIRGVMVCQPAGTDVIIWPTPLRGSYRRSYQPDAWLIPQSICWIALDPPRDNLSRRLEKQRVKGISAFGLVELHPVARALKPFVSPRARNAL